MLRSNISTKIKWLLIMGLVLLMLTSFWACSQDAIFNPRSKDKETDDTGDGDDNPNNDPGAVPPSNNGKISMAGQIVFLS